MKKILFYLSILTVVLVTKAFAQKEEMEVSKAVETLRTAMIKADSASLSELTSDGLTYGHSKGKVETKAEFIHSITSGQSAFITLEFTDQTIKLFDNTAIVRHTFSANTNDDGKPGTVKIHVLTVWQKQDGKWKLLARQAVKPI